MIFAVSIAWLRTANGNALPARPSAAAPRNLRRFCMHPPLVEGAMFSRSRLSGRVSPCRIVMRGTGDELSVVALFVGSARPEADHGAAERAEHSAVADRRAHRGAGAGADDLGFACASGKTDQRSQQRDSDT